MTLTSIDVIEELRQRSWARTNYVPAAERDAAWHPAALDEMRRKDQELDSTARINRPHIQLAAARL